MSQNPDLTPRPPLRKLLPPRAFAAPPSFARLEDGKLACRVSFDQRNGVPIGAVLMPVGLFEGQWKILQDRQPVEIPAIQHIGAEAPVTEVSSDGQIVTVKPTWPPDAERAVLLLTYPPTAVIREDQDYDEIVDHKESVLLENGVLTRSKEPVHDTNKPAAFAVGSCQFPAGILDGSVWHRSCAMDDRYIGPAERSLWRLGERLEKDHSIRFTVLTGDQVYVDRTAGLFDPSKLLERLAFAYEAFMLNAGLQRVLRVAGTDIFPMLDDHEISDNWEPRPRGFGHDEIQDELKPGRHEYMERQRTMWPEPIQEKPCKEPVRVSDKRLWAEREVHGYQFFFTDVRTQRTGRTLKNLKDGTATILGPDQPKELSDWIKMQGPQDHPSFVVSSSILLPRYLSMQKCTVTSERLGMALQTDSWAGYPKSLHNLLAWVYDANAQRMVFLSGDEHVSLLATITIECVDPPGKVVTIHSIHSSALYAPFSFANSSEEDFASPDCFEFDHDSGAGQRRRFRCRVETFFPHSGDGFTIVRPCRTEASSWRLDVEFDGADGKVRQTIQLS